MASEHGYGSRKLVAMVGAVVLFTALLVAGRLSEGVYSELMLITIGGYFAGNVGEHFAKRRHHDSV
jgi:hypothetical protein